MQQLPVTHLCMFPHTLSHLNNFITCVRLVLPERHCYSVNNYNVLTTLTLPCKRVILQDFQEKAAYFRTFKEKLKISGRLGGLLRQDFPHKFCLFSPMSRSYYSVCTLDAENVRNCVILRCRQSPTELLLI